MKKSPIENKIYTSIISTCEEIMPDGAFKGSGDYLAKKLTKLVSIGLLAKVQKKIYDALTEEPQTAREISAKTKKSTKFVSAQLKYMQDNTTLVLSKTKSERRKLWYKS